MRFTSLPVMRLTRFLDECPKLLRAQRSRVASSQENDVLGEPWAVCKGMCCLHATIQSSIFSEFANSEAKLDKTSRIVIIDVIRNTPTIPLCLELAHSGLCDRHDTTWHNFGTCVASFRRVEVLARSVVTSGVQRVNRCQSL